VPIQAAELKAVITADTSQAESGISGFGSKLAGLGTAISGGTALIGTALAGVGIAGVKMASDLQTSVANISSIKPDIDTSAVFNSLGEISTRVPQSAQSLADGLYNIFSSIDITQGDALKLVETFGKGATAAQTDVNTFGTAVMGIMNAYGQSVGDAAHDSDVFFNTVKAGVVTGPELAANLGMVTQSAKGAGIGFDELGALIVGVTKEGGPAAQNINNLSNLLQKIHTPDATKGFQALGIATTDTAGKFRSVTDVMGDLQTRLGTMTEAQRNAYIQKIFPDLQAQTAARVLMGELDSVRTALQENADGAGSTEAAYQKMSQTASAQFQLLKNTGVRVLTQLGAAILPVITPLLVAFNQQLPGAIKAFQAATEGAGGGAGLTKLQTIAFALGKAFQFVRDSVLTFVQALQGNWTDAPGIVGFQAALGNLGLFIRNVVIPAVQAFAAWVTGSLIPAIQQAAAFISANVIPALQQFSAWFMAVGLPAIQQFAAQVQTFFRDQIVPAIEAVAKTVLPMLAQAWQTISTEIIPTVVAIATTVKNNFQAIADFITAHGEAIKNIISGVWTIISATIGNELNIISNAIALVMNLIQGDWGGAWQNVQNIVTGIWNTMQTLAGVWMDALHAIVGTGMDAIKALIQTAWDGIKSAAQSAWDGIQSLIETALNAIQTTAQSVWDGIKSAAQSAWDGIKTAASNGLDGIRGVLSDAIGWAASLATSIGSAIVDGMVNGVRGAAGRLAGAARDAVGGALGAAKAFIQPGSPSRLFANEIGIPIAQGIARGIATGAGDISNALTRATAPQSFAFSTGALGGLTPAGAGASSRGGGASPVTVTLAPGAVQVYGAAGQSEESIANRVIDKLSNVFTITGRQYGLSM
jgi:TP901 family phage tail tape measure protein